MLSQLIVSAADAEALGLAARSSARSVLIDLGDSVPPTEKTAARQQALRLLRSLPWGTKRKVVRINRLDTPWAYADLLDIIEAAGDCVDAIAIPDVRQPSDVYLVDALLSRRGGQDRRIGIEAHISLSPAKGPYFIHAIAEASPLLDTLVVSPQDCASLLWAAEAYGSNGTTNGTDRWPLAQLEALLAAADRCGLRVMDGPSPKEAPSAAVQRSSRLAVGLGLSGKQCWDEEQTRIVHRIFAPADGGAAPTLYRLEEFALAVGTDSPTPSVRHGEGGGITFVPAWARE